MPKKKKPMYLVILNGGGDSDITVVSKEIFDWIEQPYPKTAEFSVEELIPGTNKKVMVTIGSGDNDRALAASAHFEQQGFGSLKAALAYIREQGGELADEYHGYIY